MKESDTRCIPVFRISVNKKVKLTSKGWYKSDFQTSDSGVMYHLVDEIVSWCLGYRSFDSQVKYSTDGSKPENDGDDTAIIGVSFCCRRF